MMDGARVPMRTKAAISPERPRKRVIRPTETTPTVGQKTTSKTVKTLRRLLSQFLRAKAQTFVRFFPKADLSLPGASPARPSRTPGRTLEPGGLARSRRGPQAPGAARAAAPG